MKEKIKLFLEDKPIRRLYLFSFLILVLQAGGILFFLKDLPLKVPLYYNLIWGERQLTNTVFLFLFPGIGYLVLFLNFFLSVIFFSLEEKDFFISRLLSWFNLLICLISSYGLFKIMALFL